MRVVFIVLAVISLATLAWAQTFDPNNASPSLCLYNSNTTAMQCANPIPYSRRADWSGYTGVPGGIPIRTTICSTFSPGVSTATLSAAISSCSAGGGGVVKLNAGTYTGLALTLNDNNVTLRGAGADQTILQGCGPLSVSGGGSTTDGRAITGGAAKSSRTFTVSSTSGLSVGQMIEVDRNNDTTIPAITTSGGTRLISQVNLITNISGTTITVKNPFFWNFNAGSPAIKFTYDIIQFSGVEDLTIDHSTCGAGSFFNVFYCYACWFKGVKSFDSINYHFTILGTMNGEFRDSFIDKAQTFGNNNGGLQFFGNTNFGGNSNWKIENNIFNRTFPGIELQNSSSFFYIGYNYAYSTASDPVFCNVTWQFDDGHGPFDMMNLWEGNIGEHFGSDGFYGGSAYGTVLRNYLTGWNPRCSASGDSTSLKRLSYYYSFLGNVLGGTLQSPAVYDSACHTPGDGPVGIYSLGYPNIGNCDTVDETGNTPVPGMTYPDAAVRSTLMRWGNYDYFNNATRFVTSEIPSDVSVPSSQTILVSYYYASKPSWWPTSGVPWPPIGSDITGGNYNVSPSPGGEPAGHVNKNPAQVCWETQNLVVEASPFNAQSCYPNDY